MKSVLVLVTAFAILAVGLAGCSHFTGKTAGQSLDDKVITTDIKAKILRDPELKTFAVDVDTYKGDVTLSGQVPNRAAERRLVQMAENTKGVKSVRTNLQVAEAQRIPASAPAEKR